VKVKYLRAYELRWLLGGALTLCGLVSVLTIDIGALPFLVPALIGNLAILTFPGLVRIIPARVHKVIPFGLVVIIVTDFIWSGGDILPPLTRMILLLAFYRTLQLRKSREDLQLVLLTLFMVVISGVLSQEIWFILQILVYAPLAMAVLFAVCLGDRQTRAGPPAEAFAEFSWSRFIRYWRGRIDRRLIFLTGLLFLATSAFATLLFLLLPRFELGQALPFLRINTARSLSGFSEEVRYGDITSILEDNAVALRVDVTSGNPPAQPYWRMLVLDAYHANGFSMSDSLRESTRFLNNFRFHARRKVPDGSGSDWTFYLEGGVSAYLPIPGDFDTLRFNNRQDLRAVDATNVIGMKEVQANTLFYRLENLLPGGRIRASEADAPLDRLSPRAAPLEEADSTGDFDYPRTTLLFPEGAANDRILRSALTEIGSVRELGPSEFMERAKGWLQAGRGYSLQTRIPDGEADRLLRWVESGDAGHCELYAGALVLLGRYAGVPTRLVTGFLGGDWNGYENYYMIRNRDAHAWVEYFEPDKGWIRIDPTPGNETDERDTIDLKSGGNIQIDRTFRAYLDSLRVLWYRRVVNFDQADQAEMVSWFREQGKSWTTGWKERWEDWKAGWEEAGFKGLEQRGLPVKQLPWLLLPLALFIFWRWQRRRGPVRRPSEIQKYRRRAGRQLRKLDQNPPKELSTEDLNARRTQLQAVRFGDPQTWPDPPLPPNR